MSNWKETEIRKLGEVVSGGTPSTSVSQFWDGEILFVTPFDLSRIDTAFIENTERKISQQGLANSSATLLPIDSIVISSRAPIGYVAIAKKELTTNQGCKSIVLNEDFDSKFIYYSLLQNVERLKKVGGGTTFAEISKGDLEKVKLPHPTDKSEQQHIARILSTADAVIEKTQAAIAKYKAIKQGMLQDLFTRGIDLNTTKLRPSYQDAPELYKESKLGMIPREWDVKEFQSVCSLITDGSHFSPKPQEDGELIVNVKDMGEYEINYSGCTRITIKDFEFLNKQNCSPEVGDILLSKDGTIGKTLLFNGKRKVVLLSSIAILRPSNLLNSAFFYTYFKSHHFENELRVKISGTAIKRIVLKAINTLNVVLPKFLEEQKLIGERILSIESKLQTEQTYLQKMQSLKKGLMEDLLSGRKQVKISTELKEMA